MTTLRVTRDVTVEECWWLSATVSEGTTVYTYHGPTYGCIDTRNGRAVSLEENKIPFFEMPYSALEGQ